MDIDPFLTPEEAAALLRVNLDTVRRLLRERKLPGVKVGKQWRIPRDAFNAFATRRADPATRAIERVAESRVEYRTAAAERTLEDRSWLESDWSRLGEIEEYVWGDNAAPKGKPVRYVPGKGLVVMGENDADPTAPTR